MAFDIKNDTPDYDEGEKYADRGDAVKAFECFERGAEKGEPVAMNALAACYDYGDGVREDKAKAAELYLKAAELGFPTAQYNYAECLRKGDGVEINEQAAIEWYTLAAANGDWFAKRVLERKANADN